MLNILSPNSSQLHILMISIVLIAIFIIVVFRNKIRNKSEKCFSKLFGVSLLSIWIVYTIYNFLPANFDIQESLPLHVCDALALTAIYILLKPNRKLSAFLFFCAIPLTGQAIATPTGEQNILLIRFWLFWLLHAGIILASVYDIAVRGYRPNFKSYLFALLCSLLYVGTIFPINTVFGFNYGFIGNSSPDVPTMVDVFGPWPLRVLWMFLAVSLVQFFMYLLSAILKRKSV